MRFSQNNPLEIAAGSVLAADRVLVAAAGDALIHSVTVASNYPDGGTLFAVIAEVQGHFAAAGAGEVTFQLRVDGVLISALVLPDALLTPVAFRPGYIQDNAASDENVHVSFVRWLNLGPGNRLIELVGSPTTQNYLVSAAAIPAEDGAALQVIAMGPAPA